MQPAEFDYAAPDSLAEALALLGEGGDVKLLAGGQSLIPTMKLRLDRPNRLIDLRKLDELRYIREGEGEISIGAMTTYNELAGSEVLHGAARCLSEAAAAVGDPQVRNLGTIGGSLSHADPAADLPAAVLALDCTMVAHSAGGDRSIPVSEFFHGLWATALQPDEILVEVRLAKRPGACGAYEKLSQAASGFALVGAAAVLEMEGDSCTSALVGVTGVGSGPLRLTGLEERLVGEDLTPELVRAACANAGDEIDSPQGDVHASAEYRRAMTGVVTGRAILRATE
jgi:carbon-monoxide dehydrogenase medium subunit